MMPQQRDRPGLVVLVYGAGLAYAAAPFVAAAGVAVWLIRRWL